jgi:hypothetical protein
MVQCGTKHGAEDCKRINCGDFHLLTVQIYLMFTQAETLLAWNEEVSGLNIGQSTENSPQYLWVLLITPPKYSDSTLN